MGYKKLGKYKRFLGGENPIAQPNKSIPSPDKSPSISQSIKFND